MIALLPHCGFLSETSRLLALARALQQRGLPVTMATHGGPFTAVLDAAGMPYTLLDPVMDAERCRTYLEGVVTLGKPGSQLQPHQELRDSVAAEAAFLRATGARMVITGFTLSAYLSSRVVGIPIATSHGGSFVPPVFERRLLPTPTQGPAPFLDRLPGAARRWLAHRGPERLTGPVRTLNQVAADLGVEPVPTLAALMVGDLTLVTDVPEVLGVPADDLRAWRPTGAAYRPDTRLEYTGPLFATLDVPVPDRVEEFLDRKGPVAYVAPSSARTEFVRRLVAGVRRAGLRAVVAAPGHDLADLEGDDVVVEPLLPSHLVMPRVDVGLIMGGQGSVQTAMASGLPFVGFPLHGEQELNVGLGVRHGLALGLGPRRATEEGVARAVRRIVGEPGFTEAAQRVRGHYAGIDGAARAAAVLHTAYAGTPADRIDTADPIAPVVTGSGTRPRHPAG